MEPTKVSSTHGKQDTFYYECSNVLPCGKDSKGYMQLYETIPVVAVLGWAGATDEELFKHVKNYIAMGYHTIRFSPSYELSALYSNYTHKSYAAKFLEVFKNHHLTANPIMIHMFSNSSDNIIYKHILQDKSENNHFFLKNNIGIIYHLNENHTNKIDLAKTLVGYAGINFEPFRSLSVSFMSIFVKYYTSLMDYIDGNSMFLKNLLNVKTPPLLFLYSDGRNPTSLETSFINEKLAINSGIHIKLAVYKCPNEYEDHIYEHLKHCKCDINQLVGKEAEAVETVDLNNNEVKKSGILKLLDSIFY